MMRFKQRALALALAGSSICVTGAAATEVATAGQAPAKPAAASGQGAVPGEPGANTPAATALEAAPVLVAGACDTPQHHQFDFWLGDWQVFDASTDKLVALDRVEKHSEGCIVEQNMTFVTDMYRRPGASYRLSGISINRYDGEQWLELWADNQWGAIAMRGSQVSTCRSACSSAPGAR